MGYVSIPSDQIPMAVVTRHDVILMPDANRTYLSSLDEALIILLLIEMK